MILPEKYCKSDNRPADQGRLAAMARTTGKVQSLSQIRYPNWAQPKKDNFVGGQP
jgi:hypothetical protein